MTGVLRTDAPITVVDLFAGCGGLTEGFHQFRPHGSDRPAFFTAGAVEWNSDAAATFTANFASAHLEHPTVATPPLIFCNDIVGWSPPWKPGEIDVVVGGPPCQGFSGLNRDQVRADRNALWQEFIRIVVALQPQVFVIENVDRFLRSAEFGDLKTRIGGEDLRNYQLVDPGHPTGAEGWERDRQYLLNAADFGAPQARRRAIVIGVRADARLDPAAMRYPAPTHIRPKRGAGAEYAALVDRKPWLTADEVLRESAALDLLRDLPKRGPSAVPGLTTRHEGPFLTTELHVGRSAEAVSLARYRSIPSRGNRKDLRGRFACRFADGTELIIEKVGAFRDGSGDLIANGAHRIVANGFATEELVSVVSVTRVAGTSPARRKIEERFEAEVLHDGTLHQADLEYLSTPSWDSHDTGSGDVMGRLRPGEPSVTIRTEFFKPEKGRYLHPTENRALTHYEAARLQGFPPDFEWYGSRTEIARQIGNAVPIPLGRAIAEAIYKYLRDTPSGRSALRGRR